MITHFFSKVNRFKIKIRRNFVEKLSIFELSVIVFRFVFGNIDLG